MAERTIIVDHKTITYEGLFNAGELYDIIDKWFYDKGFDKSEKKNTELVYPSGKQIEIELWPWRKTTDYARMVWKVHILMTNVKEVEVKIDDVKRKMNQGKIILTLSAYLETDYENKWEEKAIFQFIRTVFDKYVYGVHWGRLEGQLVDEVNHFMYIVRGYLNVHR